MFGRKTKLKMGSTVAASPNLFSDFLLILFFIFFKALNVHIINYYSMLFVEKSKYFNNSVKHSEHTGTRFVFRESDNSCCPLLSVVAVSGIYAIKLVERKKQKELYV